MHGVNIASVPSCIHELSASAYDVRFPDGALVIGEGDEGDHALLVAEGEIEVFRHDSGTALARIGPGMLLGELALISGQPRAASARAIGSVRCWRIDRAAYERYLRHSPELENLFAKKVYAQLSRSHASLQGQYKALEGADRRYRALAFLFVAMMLMLSGYALLNALLLNGFAVPADSSLRFWFSRVMEISALSILVVLARGCGLDRTAMGVTHRHLGASLLAGLGISLPIMVLMVGLRLQFWPPVAGQPVVDLGVLDWTYASYLLIAPMQEWIARGVFQTSIERLLPGKYRGLAAVVIASLVFSMLHLHLNPALAVVSLLSGLIWGALFVRYRNLAGVSLSHFLLGNWAGVIGLWGLWS